MPCTENVLLLGLGSIWFYFCNKVLSYIDFNRYSICVAASILLVHVYLTICFELMGVGEVGESGSIQTHIKNVF